MPADMDSSRHDPSPRWRRPLPTLTDPGRAAVGEYVHRLAFWPEVRSPVNGQQHATATATWVYEAAAASWRRHR